MVRKLQRWKKVGGRRKRVYETSYSSKRRKGPLGSGVRKAMGEVPGGGGRCKYAGRRTEGVFFKLRF